MSKKMTYPVCMLYYKNNGKVSAVLEKPFMATNKVLCSVKSDRKNSVDKYYTYFDTLNEAEEYIEKVQGV